MLFYNYEMFRRCFWKNIDVNVFDDILQNTKHRANNVNRGNSLVYGIGEKVWWKISSFMLKNQHTYAEISADRSVPKPLQPPRLLYFDTLILLDQKENWHSRTRFLLFSSSFTSFVRWTLYRDYIMSFLGRR